MPPEVAEARRVLAGIPASRGVAAGPALRFRRAAGLPAPRPFADAAAELARAAAALGALAEDLAERAKAASTATARDVLETQVLMAADPMLAEDVAVRVAAGEDAAYAVHGALTEQADGLRAAGGYFGERAADLEDLRDRAVARVLGRPAPAIPAGGRPFVLVADDLAPADTATLDPAVVLALVTERGGPTSHTAIIARALGLPAIVGCPGALGIEDGMLVLVDGERGELTVGIDEREAAEETARHDRVRRAELALGDGPGRTADGHRVPLLLNIGSVADLPADPESAAAVEGVGLFRTELLFLDRVEEPDFEEQCAAYEAVFRALPGRRVVVRTLDAGADKPLPFLDLGEEPNPALGVRGLRTARARPELLDRQLAAIAAAAAAAAASGAGAAASAGASGASGASDSPGASAAEVWVMAPMVATESEARDFAARARAHGLERVGVMVEIPAAALLADRILAHVDFLSIGTNDLGQYTLAADRQSGALADLLDPGQPALLALVARCAEAGAAAGKPVGVCGEAAADPRLAPVLVGLGIGSLSMSARAVPAVRAALAGHTLAEAGRLAAEALDAPS
ncbi:MAG TPA: putative PEP-binding protein [Actinospica sp.]|jgi:phosphotransferase system enzyme I (PtsI)|nr:putative PEP-binding protein [Actinospica sp.]